MSKVTMYGADWCSDCRRSKALLAAEGVEYELKDVEHSAEFASEAEQVSGRKSIPVIEFEDGLVLVEPSDADLRSALSERGLI